ncbi:hypothetical protein H4R19_005841 [Coemansia spiralis]|nr:hypothetical protein H4R19_005841 [Coemansia spiralis]
MERVVVVARAAGARAARVLSGREILDRLWHKIRCRSVFRAWWGYRRLVAESRRERQNQAIKGLDSGARPEQAFLGVVSSQRQAASARECVQEAHQRILEMLNVRHLSNYTRADLDMLSKEVGLFLSEASADKQVLSSRQVMRLFNFLAAARNSEAVDNVWQYATLSGVPLDITCYNAYLNALSFTGQTARALDVAGELRTRGLQPNSYTYACLIGLYGQSGDLDAAVRQFRSACLSSTVLVGLRNEARRALGKATQPYWHDAVNNTRLCGANIHICNAMLEVYGVNGMVQEMRLLFLQLLGMDGYTGGIATIDGEAARAAAKSRGMPPVARTFHVMIKWHAAYWDMAAAVEYAQLMSRYGIPPTGQTLKLLVTQETVKRDVEACANVALLMSSEYSVEVPRNVVRLIEVAAQKRAEMDDMVRQAEGQHTSILSGLAGIAGRTFNPDDATRTTNI